MFSGCFVVLLFLFSPLAVFFFFGELIIQAPGLEMCDVLQLRLSESTPLTIMWSLASIVGGPQWLQGLLGSLAVPLDPVAREQSRWQWGQSWWCAQTWLQGPVSGTYVVTESCCRHSYCGGDQHRQPGLGPNTLSLLAAGALAVIVISCGGTLSAWDSAQQCGLMTGIRLTASMCTAGGGSYR